MTKLNCIIILFNSTNNLCLFTLMYILLIVKIKKRQADFQDGLAERMKITFFNLINLNRFNHLWLYFTSTVMRGGHIAPLRYFAIGLFVQHVDPSVPFCTLTVVER